MRNDLEKLLSSLGGTLLESPVLSVMIVDQEMNIVWHNESYARDMGAGPDITGRKCYEVTSDVKVHRGCPTQLSLREGKFTRGLYDLGQRNAMVITIPLPGGLAAKVHAFLPKDTTQEAEVF